MGAETKAMPPPRRSRRWRQGLAWLGTGLVLYGLFSVYKTPPSGEARTPSAGKRPSESVLNSLFLSQKQCVETFPGLTRSVDDIVAEGPFHVRDTGDLGPLQGRIKDGKLYIISTQRKRDLSPEMVNSRTAALHQLHRALLTSPEPLPDTLFTLNFQDEPFGTAWGYSRAANPRHRGHGPDDRTFLMPHFSFWAWRLPFIGSLPRAARAIAALETHSHPTLASKDPRAVWRGTTWYNSVHSPRLRQNLLAATRGKAWADVAALEWNGQADNATNALAVEAFCRYRYVLHTEGVAYSGRFQFHQLCASVVLTPPIQWLQHTTHLVRPVLSSELPGRVGGRRGGGDVAGPGPGPGPGPSWEETARRSWPVRYTVDEANIVFVAPDWSDLEETVRWLEGHQREAQGIARRQRDLFAGGGYFSPAAEVCYWRALVRGWHQVARHDAKEWEGREGTPYETFVLTNGD